jgi:hypothetical protein
MTLSTYWSYVLFGPIGPIWSYVLFGTIYWSYSTKHNYNDECHFLLIIMLNVIIKCHYTEYHYNKSRGAMI